MEIDPNLQEYLSKFKRLEDFRVDVSRQTSACCRVFILLMVN